MEREYDSNDGELPPLVNRRDEYAAVTGGLIKRDEPYLYLYGPKGTGKTLLVRHALREVPERNRICYLSCIDHNTQYKVLTALCDAITSNDYSTGYHTAQLYTALMDALPNQALVLVLDDVDFLLLNDGSDLLYAISRLLPQNPRVVMLSANHPQLSTVLDERSYSSLLPAPVNVEPYTEETAVRILEQRANDWLDKEVTEDALTCIAAATTNLRIGYHWLTVAAEITDGPLTSDIIHLVRGDALRRYQTDLLAPFTEHHWLLLDTIGLLTADTEPVRSGTIYDWYRELCTQSGIVPLSTRRISDFLKHLELLHLIRVKYHYGGDEGKTRHVWLQRAGKNA